MLNLRAPHHRHPARRVAAVAVVVAVLLAASACGSDDPAPVAAGDVIGGRPDLDLKGTKTAEVVVPSGVLDVAVGPAQDSLAADDTLDLTAQDAPSGGSFVPISYRFDDAPLQDFARYMLPDGELAVTLTTDAGSYPVPQPSQTPGQGREVEWVAVDGDGSGAKLDVTYDKLTQQVDPATGEVASGRAAPIYDLPDFNPRDTAKCDTEDWFAADVVATYDCRVGSGLLLPYANGKWAAPDTLWYVTPIITNLTSYIIGGSDGRSAAVYQVQDVEDETTLDGDSPSTTIEPFQDGGSFSGALVFAVSGEIDPVLDVKQHFTLARGQVKGDGDSLDAPETLEVTVGGPVDLAS